MNPTDPMTPVRALIEAAGKALPTYGAETVTGPMLVARNNFDIAARAATASISQLLSEHDKVVEYIKELQEQAAHEMGDYIDVSAEKRAKDECADRLQSIVEGK